MIFDKFGGIWEGDIMKGLTKVVIKIYKTQWSYMVTLKWIKIIKYSVANVIIAVEMMGRLEVICKSYYAKKGNKLANRYFWFEEKDISSIEWIWEEKS